MKEVFHILGILAAVFFLIMGLYHGFIENEYSKATFYLVIYYSSFRQIREEILNG